MELRKIWFYPNWPWSRRGWSAGKIVHHGALRPRLWFLVPPKDCVCENEMWEIHWRSVYQIITSFPMDKICNNQIFSLKCSPSKSEINRERIETDSMNTTFAEQRRLHYQFYRSPSIMTTQMAVAYCLSGFICRVC